MRHKSNNLIFGKRKDIFFRSRANLRHDGIRTTIPPARRPDGGASQSRGARGQNHRIGQVRCFNYIYHRNPPVIPSLCPPCLARWQKWTICPDGTIASRGDPRFCLHIEHAPGHRNDRRAALAWRSRRHSMFQRIHAEDDAKVPRHKLPDWALGPFADLSRM